MKRMKTLSPSPLNSQASLPRADIVNSFPPTLSEIFLCINVHLFFTKYKWDRTTYISPSLTIFKPSLAKFICMENLY